MELLLLDSFDFPSFTMGGSSLLLLLALFFLCRVFNQINAANETRQMGSAIKGRYANQDSAITNNEIGRAIKNAIKGMIHPSIPPFMQSPITGMISTAVANGCRSNRMEITMSKSPIKRRIHARVVFSASAPVNISAAVFMPCSTSSNSRPPSVVYVSRLFFPSSFLAFNLAITLILLSRAVIAEKTIRASPTNGADGMDVLLVAL